MNKGRILPLQFSTILLCHMISQYHADIVGESIALLYRLDWMFHRNRMPYSDDGKIEN